jgi:hypothetical protein
MIELFGRQKNSTTIAAACIEVGESSFTKEPFTMLYDREAFASEFTGMNYQAD